MFSDFIYAYYVNLLFVVKQLHALESSEKTVLVSSDLIIDTTYTIHVLFNTLLVCTSIPILTTVQLYWSTVIISARRKKKGAHRCALCVDWFFGMDLHNVQFIYTNHSETQFLLYLTNNISGVYVCIRILFQICLWNTFNSSLNITQIWITTVWSWSETHTEERPNLVSDWFSIYLSSINTKLVTTYL